MSGPDILHEQTPEGIVVLTLNRAETMNSLSGEIVQVIIATARASKTDDSIRAIVITGNGRGFCSGADLSLGGPARGDDDGGSANRGRSASADKFGQAGQLVTALAEADVPIIGAINGAAAGAGFGLALCCDIRIASDQARMGSVFIRRGIATDYGVSYWLPRIVGLPKAYELLYSGELLDAKAAMAIGLVNRLVPHEELLKETMAYASTIAAGPPLALTYTRRAVQRSLDSDLRHQLEFEWTQQSELLGMADAREGFRAFLERRPPNFTGP